MKKLIFASIFLISAISFSQDIKATTEDGKTVILKSDKTWAYSEDPENKICDLGSNFKESDTNERLRKHAAVENDCKEQDIKFISMTEGKGNGMYSLCVKGKPMKYKKIGTVFMKASEKPF